MAKQNGSTAGGSGGVKGSSRASHRWSSGRTSTRSWRSDYDYSSGMPF